MLYFEKDNVARWFDLQLIAINCKQIKFFDLQIKQLIAIWIANCKIPAIELQLIARIAIQIANCKIPAINCN